MMTALTTGANQRRVSAALISSYRRCGKKVAAQKKAVPIGDLAGLFLV
jgi:hypothetical protein